MEINIDIPTTLKAEYIVFNEGVDYDGWHVTGTGHAVVVSFGEYEIVHLVPAIEKQYDYFYVNGQDIDVSKYGFVDRDEDRKKVAEYTLAQALRGLFSGN